VSPGAPFVRAPWHTPYTVYRQLVEGPSVEPLTLEEALLYCGFVWLPGDPREPLIRAYIAAARQKVEADTGIALLTQTWRIEIAAWSADGIALPIPPQTTPTQAITVGDVALAWTVQHGALVLGWPSPATPVARAAWPVPPFAADVIAGWPDVATLKAEAPMLVVAVGLLVAHMATTGRDLASPDAPVLVPLGYEDLIAPYRLMVLP
jgi:uncharacterized phiE125 gp8 family phage protein